MILLGYGLAILIGISLGLLGGGGAILTVPVLVYVLGVGVKQAVPMSLVVVGLSSLFGMLRHLRVQNVSLRSVALFAPAAVLGSVLGSMVGLRVSGRLQLTILAIVLLAAAIQMLRHAEAETPHAPRPPAMLAAIGGGVGMLTGLVGVGGGFLYVPALSLLGGLGMKKAVGTSLALITLSCAAGVAGYLGRVPIDWLVVVLFSALAFVGVAIGTALVPRVSQKALRRGFAGFLLLMGLLVLVRR